MIEEYLKQSEKNQKLAWKIIRDTNLIGIWESFGANVNLVGSLKMGLMSKHRDIDFHVYTSPFKLSDSFAAMAKLAENPSVKRIEYNNFLDTEEECLSWNAWVEDCDSEMWQLDIIHIVRNSRYDGYFEKVAERITNVLTDEMRNTILKLKYETPDDEKIIGIEYYRAVIEGGVSTFDKLKEWRKAHPVTGVLEWRP